MPPILENWGGGGGGGGGQVPPWPPTSSTYAVEDQASVIIRVAIASTTQTHNVLKQIVNSTQYDNRIYSMTCSLGGYFTILLTQRKQEDGHQGRYVPP